MGSMSYEFSAEEERVVNSFALKMTIIGALFGLLSIFLLIGVIVNKELRNTDRWFRAILAILQIAIGGLLIYPGLNFRNVMRTEGNDIYELMTGIRKLKFSLWTLLYLVIGLLVISIFLSLSP